MLIYLKQPLPESKTYHRHPKVLTLTVSLTPNIFCIMACVTVPSLVIHSAVFKLEPTSRVQYIKLFPKRYTN